MLAVQASSGKARIASKKVWFSKRSRISPVNELQVIPLIEKVGEAGWLTAQRAHLGSEVALDAKLSACDRSLLYSSLEDGVCTRVM